MATAAPVSYLTVEQYLHTAYRPDVDYVDGYIEERNLGEFDHGRLIGRLFTYFEAHRREWKIRVALDTRMQISETRFRVPDLSISSISAPKEQILRTPPMLCIEVLSPEDTFAKMRRRVEDYFRLGVGDVWIIDFEKRNVTLCRPDGSDTIQTSGMARVAGTLVAIPLDEIFAALDED